MGQDLYTLLGVAPDAGADQISRAYARVRPVTTIRVGPPIRLS